MPRTFRVIILRNADLRGTITLGGMLSLKLEE